MAASRHPSVPSSNDPPMWEWTPPYWYVLRCGAAQVAREGWTTTDAERLSAWFQNTAVTLPCADCARHYDADWVTHPFRADVEGVSPTAAAAWVEDLRARIATRKAAEEAAGAAAGVPRAVQPPKPPATRRVGRRVVVVPAPPKAPTAVQPPIPEWAPQYWYVMRCAALQAHAGSSDADKERLVTWFRELEVAVPCPECRGHYAADWAGGHAFTVSSATDALVAMTWVEDLRMRIDTRRVEETRAQAAVRHVPAADGQLRRLAIQSALTETKANRSGRPAGCASCGRGRLGRRRPGVGAGSTSSTGSTGSMGPAGTTVNTATGRRGMWRPLGSSRK